MSKPVKCPFCNHTHFEILSSSHLGTFYKCYCCGQVFETKNLSIKGLVVKTEKLDDCNKWCDENE